MWIHEGDRLMPIQRFAADAMTRTSAKSWSVAQRGHIIEAGYGSDSDFPQYAALHTDSSFLRLNYGPRSAWGTSIVLLPSLWLGGSYHQGAHITVDWRHKDTDLLMSFNGSISTLQVEGEIQLKPPGANSISGTVMVKVDGEVDLDCRPGEAFKPVALSSMHVAANHWDARSAQIDTQPIQIPDRGWLIGSSALGRRFELKGGSSAWKANAPTISIVMEKAWELAGWKGDSVDPDDDDLSLWAAADHVPRFWKYAFTARP
jgi:hypothetical protein